MTLKPYYFALLDHLGQTQPVGMMPPNSDAENLVCLRHDIDHSLDVALEMAFWESDRGYKATYYLLNSAPYWNDPLFDIKVRQLVSFGHEVGLHVDSIANWLAGNVNDPAKDFYDALNRLRSLGANANSTAAHGNRLCYEHGVTNFWMFSSEKHMLSKGEAVSAEGIHVDDQNFQIKMPGHDVINNSKNESFDLWSVELDKHDLEFLAHRANWTRYFTDSGGDWKRSDNPLNVTDIRKGRTMVLVHPEHWIGTPRQHFVLSPARSGSTWLAEIADQATSARGLHELALNATLDGGVLKTDKKTNYRLNEFLEDKVEIKKRLEHRHSWFETQSFDVFECNVYLAHVFDELKKENPDANFVQLLRDPREILVSLLNRGWYDLSSDNSHPIVDGIGWESLSQIEKAAHYIRHTNELIIESKPEITVRLEELSGNHKQLGLFFRRLGIAYYPLLADGLISKKINQNRHDDIASFDSLTDLEKQRAIAVLQEQLTFGSHNQKIDGINGLLRNDDAFAKMSKREKLDRLSNRNCTMALIPNLVERTDSDGTFYFRNNINGSVYIVQATPKPTEQLDWSLSNKASDFTHKAGQHYRFYTKGLKVNELLQLLVLVYDETEKLIETKRIIPKIPENLEIDCEFALRSKCKYFRIVFYRPKKSDCESFSVTDINLETAKIREELIPKNHFYGEKHAVMLVANDCLNDSRVIKSAESVASLGFGKVTVVCASSARLSDSTHANGVNYLRINTSGNSRKSAGHTKLLKRLIAILSWSGFMTRKTWLPEYLPLQKIRKAIGLHRLEYWKQALMDHQTIAVLTGQRFSKSVLATLIELNPDIIHCHDLKTVACGKEAADQLAVPLIYDAHELETERNASYSPKVWNGIEDAERSAIANCDQTITVSESIADHLANMYAITRPEVIFNTPDLENSIEVEAGVRDVLNLEKNDCLLIYLGKIGVNRGLESAVAAMKMLPKNFHFVAVGPRDEKVRELLDQDAAKLGVQNRVHFLNAVNPQVLLSFVRSADVSLALITGSCLSYEYCMPNKLFESIFAGVPLIVSPRKDMRTIVENTNTGVVLKDVNPESIAKAALKITTQPSAFRIDAKKIEEIAETYSWQQQQKKLSAIYAKLLESN